MTHLIPFTLMTETSVLSALRFRAAKEGRSPEEVAGDILRGALGDEMEDAAGVPPLAEVIQQHHNQQQAAARAKTRLSRSSVLGAR
jgi:plasmid stability protein